MGYVEANLKTQDISTFNEDVMLVIADGNYGQRVPTQLGTLQLDNALDLVSEEELAQLST